MALNDIQLNSSLLATMYRNSLVDLHNERSEPEKPGDSLQKNPATDEWKYLGNYKKNILVAVRYETVTYLPDEQLKFLTSILGACKLGLADIAILNVASAPSPTYKAVQANFKSSHTILFGISPQEFEMPINFPEFQIQPFNSCTFLHTPGLEELGTDKILKSKLWVCLQRMFGLTQ